MSEEDARVQLDQDAVQSEEDKIKWVAHHLRLQILQLPKTKTPSPTTVEKLKECSPQIPAQLQLFSTTLLGVTIPSFSGNQRETKATIDRKVTAMESDAIFNVTNGTVKP